MELYIRWSEVSDNSSEAMLIGVIGDDEVFFFEPWVRGLLWDTGVVWIWSQGGCPIPVILVL
jgi:hypothetical protein